VDAGAIARQCSNPADIAKAVDAAREAAVAGEKARLGK
jgi:hypothetical protein